jgi:hypothetical protein
LSGRQLVSIGQQKRSSLPSTIHFFDAPRRQPQLRQQRQFRQIRPRVPIQTEQLSAPAPRHAEKAPTIRILVIGDSMAEWLAYGLEEVLAETPEIGIVRKNKDNSGLIRYEQRSDVEWSKIARALIATEKPQAIVMLIGLHDRQTMRERPPAAVSKPAAVKPAIAEPTRAITPQASTPPAPAKLIPNDDETPTAAPEAQRPRFSGPADFRTEKWEELYNTRIDETIAALKTANAPVLWVSVPALRDAKSNSDLLYLNDLVKARVEKAGLIFVNAWDGFVDERNNFIQRGPDETGQIRVLRTNDGIHFTKFGARKLAHYVERDLRRVLREPIPAALVTPAEPAQAAKPSGSSRPLAGPVIALNSPLTEPDDLLGGPPLSGTVPAAPAMDPVANRTLVRGEPSRAEAGRADDFVWPPRLPNLVLKEPLPLTGAPLTIVRAVPPAGELQAAPSKAASPVLPSRPQVRVARQPPVQSKVRQEAQAPTFWRRQTDNSGPPIFFGLFGGR